MNPVSDERGTNAKQNDGWAAQQSMLAVLSVIGLISPILTFLLAVSSIDYSYKIAGLITIAGIYLVICIWSYSRLLGPEEPFSFSVRLNRDGGAGEIQQKLLALEEANQFFGSLLKAADMFRLVSSRVSEICEFSGSTLFVADETKTKLRITQADGKNAELLQDLEIPSESGLAGMAYISREVEKDACLALERSSMPAEAIEGFHSAVAIPLIHDGEIFGVYQLYSESELDAGEDSTELFEAIGERVTPLLLGSIAFERSLSNALTDPLTNLPNERAFFMILENQLAESHRFRDERPLTVLAVDLKGFTKTNANFGHAAGDRMLVFASGGIKAQLRKMDFLARSINDEFVIILPTASEDVAKEIISRINKYFAVNPFAITEDDELKIWLNFGWATFWKDGETAHQLLQNAQLRKAQAKSEDSREIVEEYVN